jgi:hypothetical protein
MSHTYLPYREPNHFHLINFYCHVTPLQNTTHCQPQISLIQSRLPNLSLSTRQTVITIHPIIPIPARRKHQIAFPRICQFQHIRAVTQDRTTKSVTVSPRQPPPRSVTKRGKTHESSGHWGGKLVSRAHVPINPTHKPPLGPHTRRAPINLRAILGRRARCVVIIETVAEPVYVGADVYLNSSSIFISICPFYCTWKRGAGWEGRMYPDFLSRGPCRRGPRCVQRRRYLCGMCGRNTT